MKPLLKNIIKKQKQFNNGDMAAEVFGFQKSKHYDVLVVAPGWKPTKILKGQDCTVTITAEHSYISGYEVQWNDKSIAWAQTSSGGNNLIDHLMLCTDLNFDKLVFIGAVGGLKPGFAVGDICTPSYCIDGSFANAYLSDDPTVWKPYSVITPSKQEFIEQVRQQAPFPISKASVFCTDSISCEYFHLDFIKDFNCDLIEMETGSFYLLADLLEKPAIALLVVSDNSANAEPLLGKPEAQKNKYNRGRKELISLLIRQIADIDL